MRIEWERPETNRNLNIYRARGTYFLQTNSVAPYGRSNYSGLYV